MAACTQCGAKLLDDVRFCTQCGADQAASFSEALTFVPSPDSPRPDGPSSDTATVPVIAAPPPASFDPLSEFAGPDIQVGEPRAETAFYEPPPPRAPSPPTKEYDLRPKSPAPPPVDLSPEPAAPAYSPPPFPPPPLVPPLPGARAAAPAPVASAVRPGVVFPPASDRPAISQTTRNLVLMGALVWGFAGLVYLAYAGWRLWSPGSGSESDAVADSPPAATTAADATPTATPVVPATPTAGQSVFTGHTAAVTALAVSSDRQHVLSGGGQGDCSVRIWDLNRGAQSGRFEGHGQDCAILVATFTAAGRAASAAGPTDFALRVWDPASGGELRQLSGGEGLIFRAVAPDGTRAIGQEIGGPDGGGGFSLWNLETGARLSTVSARGLAASFAFSPAGDRILSGGDSGQLAVWDAATGEQLQVFPGHGAGVAVSAVAFAPNRRLLISAGSDERVVLWDPGTGVQFRSVAGATTFAMADDSRTLAVGEPGGAIRVLDAIRGEEHARFTGHQGAVQALAWAPGGRGLISGGADKTVRVWSVDPRP